jgi:hypothetical protein
MKLKNELQEEREENKTVPLKFGFVKLFSECGKNKLVYWLFVFILAYIFSTDFADESMTIRKIFL